MQTLLSVHNTKALIDELVAELMGKINMFDGYTAEAMEPVCQLAKTDYTFAEMKKALLNMAENHQFLRYGNTVKAEHICSFRAYMIGTDDYVLAVRDHKLVTIPRAEAEATNPDNHWIILRHDDMKTYSIYNQGTGYYLTVGGEPSLADVPHKITANFSNGTFTFREGASRAIGFNTKDELVTVSPTRAARWTLLDNYYLTPSTRLCNSLLEQTTEDAISTGIEEIEPLVPFDNTMDEAEGYSLSDDIVAVYYYDLNGQRIGYALPKGQPVIAHIVLRNGASMVRKIVAK